jgi:hypothetical protein
MGPLVEWSSTLLQMNRYFTLDSADLVVPNQEAWGLLWDFQTLVHNLALSHLTAC